jgi:hypothetical protein
VVDSGITRTTLDQFYLSGPVAIGGVGGSGTRVVAQFLKELGFYIGDDLNAANDNLWFTLLLARSKWFAESTKEDISRALSIFEKAMTGRLGPERDELGFLIRAAIDFAFFEYFHWAQTPVKRFLKKIGPVKWTLQMMYAAKRIFTMTRTSHDHPLPNIGWGWKEPCTYAYIEHLAQCFVNVKYIHVIRNGLDMAYSRNQGHLIAWGWRFGVQTPNSPALLPRASLDYWIRANEAAIAQGARILGDRFMVVNFDQLCLEPRDQVVRLIDFLELDPRSADVDRLCGLVSVPSSLGRHREHRPEFSLDDIDAVRRLGFSVTDT